TRFAQTVAEAALSDQEFIEKCKQQNAKGIAYLNAQFERLGLSAYPAHGNFIMVNVRRPADQVFHALMRKGFIVRGGHQLGMPSYLRLSVGSQQQNESFVMAIEEVLQEVTIEI